MLIYIGADHRGYKLKTQLKQLVEGLGYEIVDCGNEQYEEGDDYPDFAAKVAKEVAQGPGVRRGIVLCGSGVGVDIVANRFQRVRAGLGINTDQIYDARHDDDINVLAIAADHVAPEEAEALVKVFLGTPFGGEDRHKRRLQKIQHLGM